MSANSTRYLYLVRFEEYDVVVRPVLVQYQVPKGYCTYCTRLPMSYFTRSIGTLLFLAADTKLHRTGRMDEWFSGCSPEDLMREHNKTVPLGFHQSSRDKCAITCSMQPCKLLNASMVGRIRNSCAPALAANVANYSVCSHQQVSNHSGPTMGHTTAEEHVYQT